MSNPNHTPTPWREGEQWRIESPTPGGGCVVVADERSIGNYQDRAFILRACNSHAQLLEACKLVDRAWAGDGVGMAAAVDACLLAITAATGG